MKLFFILYIINLEAEVANLKNKYTSKDITEETALKMFEAKLKKKQENGDIEEVGNQEVFKFNQSTVQVQQDRVKHMLE